MKPLLLLALVVCGGCAKDRPSASAESVENAYICNNTGDPNIFDCRLSDGTRCVVYANYRVGSITCDWSKREGVE